MKKIILIGAGGHAKSCLDIVKSVKKFNILGFIDNVQKGYFEKYKILGGDDYLDNIKDKKKINLALTLGQIKNYKKELSYLINLLNSVSLSRQLYPKMQ